MVCSLSTALLKEILAGRDCLVAGDSCSSDETCSPRLRTLRQCVAGNGSMKLGPGARSQCANAVSALLSSPLHGCQCKRGMKKEKNCLSIYWSLHQSIIHGLLLLDKLLHSLGQNAKFNEVNTDNLLFLYIFFVSFQGLIWWKVIPMRWCRGIMTMSA